MADNGPKCEEREERGKYELEDVKCHERQTIAKRRRRVSFPKEVPEIDGTDLIGLALSGGGIRSAATNIGVLQGLAQRDVLPRVDYLSAVSGGGYIAGCLSSLLTGRCGGAKFSTRWQQFPFREDKTEKEKKEEEEKDDRKNNYKLGRAQMHHLRTRASYLAPRAHHLSANVMRLLGAISSATFASLFWFALCLTIITSSYLALVTWVAPEMAVERLGGQDSSLTINVNSGELQAIPGQEALSFREVESGFSKPLPGEKGRVGQIVASAMEPFEQLTLKLSVVVALFGVLLGVIAGQSAMAHQKKVPEEFDKKFYLYPLLLFSLLLLVLLAGERLVGLLSEENCLETLKLNKGAVLAFPPLVVAGALLANLTLLWCGTKTIDRRSARHKLLGLLFAFLLFSLVLALLPPLMVIGTQLYHTLLLALLGAVLRQALTGSKNENPATAGHFALAPKYKKWLLGLGTWLFLLLAVIYVGNLITLCLPGELWTGSYNSENLKRIVVIGGIAAALLLLFHLCVDANQTAAHYFYRDRLAETFLKTGTKLGPGDGDNQNKHPWWRDNSAMELAQLQRRNNGRLNGDIGPYLLLNATLNLTAARDLHAFNRKSEIFTFSRDFIGSERLGYFKTGEYECDGGPLKLARAMAISGAAVTSVMGMNTSFTNSFLCTVFGVRLGYWLPNPQLSAVQGMARKFASCKRMYKEFLGHTTAEDAEIYLSDGGHSGDNLAILPLLRRRVRGVIVSDSECDPEHAFNSFNSSLRTAYVDEGIKIDISLKGLREKDDKKRTLDKFALGRIIYPNDDKKSSNWLILYKNTINGQEHCTICNYKQKHSTFPHESTADQFFSEEQFESYRALGRFAFTDALSSWGKWRKACSCSVARDRRLCRDVYLELQPEEKKARIRSFMTMRQNSAKPARP